MLCVLPLELGASSLALSLLLWVQDKTMPGLGFSTCLSHQMSLCTPNSEVQGIPWTVPLEETAQGSVRHSPRALQDGHPPQQPKIHSGIQVLHFRHCLSSQELLSSACPVSAATPSEGPVTSSHLSLPVCPFHSGTEGNV